MVVRQTDLSDLSAGNCVCVCVCASMSVCVCAFSPEQHTGACKLGFLSNTRDLSAPKMSTRKMSCHFSFNWCLSVQPREKGGGGGVERLKKEERNLVQESKAPQASDSRDQAGIFCFLKWSCFCQCLPLLTLD